MATNRMSIAILLPSLLGACRDSALLPDPQQFLDLGIRDSSAPMAGIYCSGQPSAEQFAQLASAGVTRVVSLRLASEPGTGWEEAKAQELGLEFVRIPVEGEKGLTVDNAAAMARQLTGARGAVLVSCGSANRVGALFALKARLLDGKTAEEAIAIGRSCGMTTAETAVARIVSR